MKTLIAACVLAAAGAAQAATISGFNGPFAVTEWSFATTDDGNVNTDGAPDSIVLTGGDSYRNSPEGSDSTTDFTIRLDKNTLISFSWAYETLDDDSFYDPFGYLLGEDLNSLLFTQLTIDNLTEPQSGAASVFVQAGETFGFRAFSIGSNFGPGVTTINGFRATSVPEPGALALVSLALLAAAAARRRPAQ